MIFDKIDPIGGRGLQIFPDNYRRINFILAHASECIYQFINEAALFSNLISLKTSKLNHREPGIQILIAKLKRI